MRVFFVVSAATLLVVMGCGQSSDHPIQQGRPFDAAASSDSGVAQDADAAVVSQDAASAADATNDHPDAAEASAPLDCSTIETAVSAGVKRQTGGSARLGTTTYDNVDFTQFSSLWETENKATGKNYMTAWPGTHGNTFVPAIVPNRYVAFEFDTGKSTQLQGSFSVDMDTEWGGGGVPVISLSECPGDFRPALGRCTRHAAGGIGWAIAASGSNPSVCYLKPDTTYYVNIIYAVDAAHLDQTKCTNFACGSVFVNYY